MSLSSNFPTVRPTLVLDFLKSRTVDPRITFTRASTATYFDEDGILQTAGSDVPRIDFNPTTLACNGLLIEESRTNSIRNNTMVGAVAPSTAPTNWVLSASGTGTFTVVGTGTENGITYIEIQLADTVAAQSSILFEATTQVVAADTQTWTNSFYFRRVSGGTTVTYENRIVFRTAAGAGVTTQNVVFSPSTSSISTQRYSNTFTAANATIARVTGQIALTTSGADTFTFRIGLPQLEQGAFATSIIPTTTTALTRNADVANVNTLTPWFNATASTLYAEWTNNASAIPTGGTQIVAEITDLISSNFYRIFQSQAAGVKASTNMFSGGVNPGRLDAGGAYSTATVKAASAFAASDRAISANGGAPVTSATGALPVGVTTLGLGSQPGSVNFINGWLRRIAYYPVRATNAQLQALTL